MNFTTFYSTMRSNSNDYFKCLSATSATNNTITDEMDMADTNRKLDMHSNSTSGHDVPHDGEHT